MREGEGAKMTEARICIVRSEREESLGSVVGERKGFEERELVE